MLPDVDQLDADDRWVPPGQGPLQRTPWELPQQIVSRVSAWKIHHHQPCPECGKMLPIYSNTRNGPNPVGIIACRPTCRRKAYERRRWHRGTATVTCLVCEREFMTAWKTRTRARFCSRQCKEVGWYGTVTMVLADVAAYEQEHSNDRQ